MLSPDEPFDSIAFIWSWEDEGFQSFRRKKDECYCGLNNPILIFMSRWHARCHYPSGLSFSNGGCFSLQFVLCRLEEVFRYLRSGRITFESQIKPLKKSTYSRANIFSFMAPQCCTREEECKQVLMLTGNVCWLPWLTEATYTLHYAFLCPIFIRFLINAHTLDRFSWKGLILWLL